MRMVIGLSALALLAACGSNRSEADRATANAAQPVNAVAPVAAAAPGNSTAPVNALASAGSRITPRPVLVGVDAELDKCPTNGRFSGTRPVTVRTAPNAAAGEAGTLTRATNIAICDQDDRADPQAGWYAIVYPADGGELGGCGLGGASAGNGGAPYSGPCRSGWVRSTDIEVIAG